ncbi:MAG: hypothetical protein EBR82_84005 [Caulobacteraceae bacterium]|nr:hypothetical protein [Caulobacteraceae bacterium]
MSAMSELDIIKQEVFEFLDDLRDSGETNMYGAAPYIVEEFGVRHAEARVLLSAWMQTFSERHAA